VNRVFFEVVSEFLPLLSVFSERFGEKFGIEDLHVIPLGSLSFLKIGAVKEVL
jgi:hypothetical protein